MEEKLILKEDGIYVTMHSVMAGQFDKKLTEDEEARAYEEWKTRVQEYNEVEDKISELEDEKELLEKKLKQFNDVFEDYEEQTEVEKKTSDDETEDTEENPEFDVNHQ